MDMVDLQQPVIQKQSPNLSQEGLDHTNLCWQHRQLLNRIYLSL